MAVVRLAYLPGGTTERYAAIAREVGDGPRPAGRLLFAAGPREGGWQLVQDFVVDELVLGQP